MLGRVSTARKRCVAVVLLKLCLVEAERKSQESGTHPANEGDQQGDTDHTEHVQQVASERARSVSLGAVVLFLQQTGESRNPTGASKQAPSACGLMACGCWRWAIEGEGRCTSKAPSAESTSTPFLLQPLLRGSRFALRFMLQAKIMSMSTSAGCSQPENFGLVTCRSQRGLSRIIEAWRPGQHARKTIGLAITISASPTACPLRGYGRALGGAVILSTGTPIPAQRTCRRRCREVWSI